MRIYRKKSTATEKVLIFILRSIVRIKIINIVVIFRANQNGLLGLLQSMSVRRFLVCNDGDGNSLLSRRSRLDARHLRGRWKRL